jgi:glycosyltransferase involved in cell wall biosynthesis
MNARFDVFLPIPLTKRGPSYTCGMLVQGMAGSGLDATIVTPRVRSFPVNPARVVQTLPLLARYMPYRWVKHLATAAMDSAFLDQVGDVSQSLAHGAYIWPDAALQTILDLKRLNIKIFREMINCHRGTAKSILDDAYARISEAPTHGISEATVYADREALDATDYIFCPSPMVEESLLENRVPASKILSASYGWDPARLHGSNKFLEPSPGVTMVFAGSIGVRKGCHLLLEYWAKSKVHGRLVLAGVVEPTIKRRWSELLSRDDVVVLDFVSNVGALYRSADIFVLPSLEEGSPLVTYEACGSGLPVITTAMGAGGVVRHMKEGFVLHPYDCEGWIAAIRALADDKDLRQAMSVASAERAQLFRWDIVAKRRRRQILDRLVESGDANGDVFERTSHERT